MLRIGLARIGKKKQPYYRIEVQEKKRDPFGASIEIVGSLNPHTEPRAVQLKEERIKYWLSQGAKPTATVHNLLVDAGILKLNKIRTVFSKKKGEEKPKPEVKLEAKTEKPAEEKQEG